MVRNLAFSDTGARQRGQHGSRCGVAGAVTGQVSYLCRNGSPWIPRTRNQPDHLLADPRRIRSQGSQSGDRDAVTLADKTKEQVFGADVVVVHLQCFSQRKLENLLGSGRERRGATRCAPGHTDRLFDSLTYRLEGDPQRLQRLGADAIAFADDPEEDVLSPDEAVVEQSGFFLCEDQNDTCPVGEAFEHGPQGIAIGPESPKPLRGGQGRTGLPKRWRCTSRAHGSKPRRKHDRTARGHENSHCHREQGVPQP